MKRAGRTTEMLRVTGFLLLIVGLGWLIGETLLRKYYPSRFGGPNIGGGAVVILAVVAVLAGIVIVTLDIVDHRIDRDRKMTAGMWIGIGLNGILVAVFVAVLVVRPGDPSAGQNGQVGLTASAAGSPVLVLEICRGSIDDVTVVGPNRGSVPNAKLARFHTGRPAGAGTLLFDLADPPVGWTQQPGERLSTTDLATLKIASGSGPKNGLRQVSFTGAELSSVTSGTVLYSAFDGRVAISRRMPLAEFRAFACP